MVISTLKKNKEEKGEEEMLLGKGLRSQKPWSPHWEGKFDQRPEGMGSTLEKEHVQTYSRLSWSLYICDSFRILAEFSLFVNISSLLYHL